MKQLKIKFFWLAAVMVLAMALLAACGLPSGYSIATINEFGVSPEPGIISMAPPGLVPEPPPSLTATAPSGIIKTPHTLEGRIGYCLDHHGINGDIPSPPSHVGRPQDTCTVCHQASWEVLNNRG